MKVVVLLSGGVDSATCLALAVREYGSMNVSALSVSYGQKHSKEIDCAQKLANHYGVKLYFVDLSSTMKYSDCPLLKDSNREIRHESYADQILKDGAGTVDTYVPFRNGLMLSSAATLALSIYPGEKVMLMYGAHADDAAGHAYPDCSENFVDCMENAVNEGSGGLLTIWSPLIRLNKAQVVHEGLQLKVPYELTWSCYEGGEKACGTCGTCIDRKAAFAANGVEDPIEYEE